MHEPLLRRLVRYGHGFHPVGVPSADDLDTLTASLAAAGRSLDDFELIGGTRAEFPDDDSCADLGPAMDAIGPQLDAGYTTFGLKPSQYLDDGARIGPFCRDVMRRAAALAG